MNILVCIREVTKQVESFDKNGFIKRKDKSLRLNKNDLFALEQALKFKGNNEITVLTMGNEKSKSILKEALSMGANKGVLLDDINLKNADMISTARALREAIKALGIFDLILCGESSSESKGAMVGGMLGELLNYNVLQNVTSIRALEEECIKVVGTMNENLYEGNINIPAVLTIRESKEIPRFPNYLDILRSEKEEIKELTVESFSIREKKNYGYEGSDVIIAYKRENNVIEKMKDERISENKVHKGTVLELTDVLEEKLKSLEVIL